jgi:hypothetical protein
MKGVIAAIVTAAVVAPTGFAIGTAHDPRVPALQFQVHALQHEVAALQTQQAALQHTANTFQSDYVSQNVAARVVRLCVAVKQTAARSDVSGAFRSFLDWFVISGPGLPAVC